MSDVMDMLAEEAAPPPAQSDAPSSDPVIVIRPRRGWIGIDWRELWQYRELLYFLVWRDFKGDFGRDMLSDHYARFFDPERPHVHSH